jgi:hypothetical protein
MKNYMGSFEQIFSLYGFLAHISHELLNLIAKQNISNISDDETRESSHIYSRQTSKWKEYFSPHHKALFKDMFGDALVKLGYEEDNNW